MIKIATNERAKTAGANPADIINREINLSSLLELKDKEHLC